MTRMSLASTLEGSKVLLWTYGCCAVVALALSSSKEQLAPGRGRGKGRGVHCDALASGESGKLRLQVSNRVVLTAS